MEQSIVLTCVLSFQQSDSKTTQFPVKYRSSKQVSKKKVNLCATLLQILWCARIYNDWSKFFRKSLNNNQLSDAVGNKMTHCQLVKLYNLIVIIRTMLPSNQRQTTCKCVYLVTFLYPVFCSCDIDLDLMTFIYENDLDIVKMYLFT